ncbi:tetratricopeptide repeat protein [Nostoc sp. C110]|uniref:tetratricopeptide repeat protein n=1 Tax=Nostoc sp. C110 TaxID=3349876 RepID=UPI00370D87DA
MAGMGGVGKTELATQYARQHQDDYLGGICWLNAREGNLATEIINQFKQFLKLEIPEELKGKPLEEQVWWCWHNWQPPEGLVLVVLDDVVNLESFYQLLPKVKRFRVLITTRLRNLDPDIEEIPLDVLSPEDALNLLTKLVGDTRVQKEKQQAQELCKRLGYLPLGLQLVGRYLRKKPLLSLEKMLQRLEEQRELLNQPQSTVNVNIPLQGVKAVFELSWKELNPTSQRMGEFLSLFVPTNIPWQLVEYACESLNWQESDVETANEQLYEHHLIEQLVEGEPLYKIHPLIRGFLQAKLEEAEHSNQFRQAFATALVEIAKKVPRTYATEPGIFTRESFDSVKDAIPHLEELVQNLTDAIKDEDLSQSFSMLGKFYRIQGFYKLYQSWHEKSVVLLQKRLGKTHPSFATCLGELGVSYLFQGQYIEAESILKEVLELRQNIFGEEHSDVAESFDHLGLVYRLQGKLEEAEPLLLKGLDLRKHLLGEENLQIVHSFLNLAVLYRLQGRFDEAEDYLQKVLVIQERFLGREHPDIARSMDILGTVYCCQGRLNESEQLHLKALKLQRTFFREKDPPITEIKRNLADVYRNQGRLDDAEVILGEVLELQKSLWGERNRYVIKTIHRLAQIYRLRGKRAEEQESFAEAESFYQTALDLQNDLPEEERKLIPSMLDLAQLYQGQKNGYKKEEPLRLKILEEQRLRSAEPQYIAKTLQRIAAIYRSNNRKNEAKPFYREAEEIYLRMLGDNDINTFKYRKDLEYCQSMLQK